jgi:hypothetical protein
MATALDLLQNINNEELFWRSYREFYEGERWVPYAVPEIP